MKLIPTKLKGCFILEPQIFTDDRGYFYESFSQKKFTELSESATVFVQDNQAHSSKGVVRGLHLQRPPYCQAKLLRVLQGEIIDVAVDVRKNSPTYGQHIAVKLTDKNHKQLFIPRGFVHGYSVLSETATIAYKCDDYYNKKAEDAIHPFDSDLAIDWGIQQAEALLSDKDLKSKNLQEFQPI